MQLQNISNKEKLLLNKLSELVEKYGFMEVLSLLEYMASNQANYSMQPWENIRKNLEDSILEIEEWNISNNIN
ncbi:MAG: hypothetical protein ACOYLO_00545 [Ferruginibacter sp.]